MTFSNRNIMCQRSARTACGRGLVWFGYFGVSPHRAVIRNVLQLQPVNDARFVLSPGVVIPWLLATALLISPVSSHSDCWGDVGVYASIDQAL